MRRSPGLIALTRRRAATPRSAAIVVVVLTLLASFLISAAPRALAVVLHDEVAFQVDRLSTVTRDLTASARNVRAHFGPSTDAALTQGWAPGADQTLGALAERLAEIRAEASASVQEVTSQASFYLSTDPERVYPSPERDPSPRPWVQLLFDPEMPLHLRLGEGDWPAIWAGEGAIEIAMTREAAEDLLWELGETREGPGGLLLLVGLLDVIDEDAARWSHLPRTALRGVYDFDGNSPPTMTAGVYVHPASPVPIGASTELAAWYPLSPAAISAQEPDVLLAGLRELSAQMVPLGGETKDGVAVRVRFETTAIPVLETSLRRADSTSMTLAVAAVGPVAVSLALILLAAGLIIRRRRGDLLLLSARGTSIGRLRRILLLEGLLLGIVPAVGAAVAAIMLIPRDAGALPTVLAVAVGFVPAITLALSLRPSTLSQERADIDTARASRWVRLLGLLIIVIAALAVGLLLYRGIGRGSTGVDPLVIAAPLLATVALGLVAVRLHPLWLAAVLRGAQRGTRLVNLVGAARSLRDPTAGTTAVLAMMVAVAIAVFSSLILATVDRGALVNAERQVGGQFSVSGPAFAPEVIAQIAALDEVEQVTGIHIAERGQVVTAKGRISMALLITDFAALAAIQEGFIEAFDPAGVRLGEQPPQVLASPEVIEAVGLGDATGPVRGVTIVGELPWLGGNTAGESFLVMDRGDYANASPRGFYPRKLVMSLSPEADIAAVEQAIRELAGTSLTAQNLDARTQAIQSSPAITALRTALLIALVLAVLLSVIAILLVAAVSRDARSRVIALLRTMGAGRRSGRGIVAWEFAPLGISALVGGLILGVALPLLVRASIDFRPFTGGGRQPDLVVDPVLTAGLVASVVIALIIAVLGGMLTARTVSLVTVLRTEEDR